MVPVANNMTSYFQPIDLTVNRCCKAFLKSKAQTMVFGAGAKVDN